MLKIKDSSKKILDKYKINYNIEDVDELLLAIDDIMTDYVDDHDEPLEQFLELEQIYDEIYLNN